MHACVCLFQCLQSCSFNWTERNYRGQTSFICTHSVKYPEWHTGGLTNCTYERSTSSECIRLHLTLRYIYKSKSKLNRPSPECSTECLMRDCMLFPSWKVWIYIYGFMPHHWKSQFVKHQLNFLPDFRSPFCLLFLSYQTNFTFFSIQILNPNMLFIY